VFKELILFGLASVAAVIGVVYFLGNPKRFGDYAASPAVIQEKLLNARLPDGNWAPLRGYANVSAPNENQVVWSSEESGLDCSANITGHENGTSEVLVFCGLDSGIPDEKGQTVLEMQETRIREFVDATLTGRAYDASAMKAMAGVTVLKNMKGMQRAALRNQKLGEEEAGNARAFAGDNASEEWEESEDWSYGDSMVQ